ncbi:MAG: hypothetical protein JO235_06310 [Chroococcidiopsidaceae cyanobacterium CP_BM_RX_35]|nr:hypothetical protein [Chroococcidiopsidaceae cyanobacterium CP_BM_RX_35]
MLRILLIHSYWLIASVAFTVLTAALAPSQAWMWKSFIDGLKADGSTTSSSLLSYVLLFGGLQLYSKVRQTYPALLRVLQPEIMPETSETQGDRALFRVNLTT